MKKQYLAVITTLALFAPATLQAMTESEADIKAFEEMFPEGQRDELDFWREDRLLISATGSQVPVHLAPSVASVVTADDIKAMGATTLNQVLETVPGLHVSPSGLSAYTSIWSIRGISTGVNPHVLMLVNGIPLTYSYSGARIHAFDIPVEMISRVEVVRGPGSAVHGADAFAGTINVITKDGHEVDGTSIGLRHGSFDTTSSWLQHGGTYGGWNMVASIETRKTDGDDERVIKQDMLGSGPPSLAPEALNTASDEVDFHLGFNKDDQWIARFYGNLQNDAGMGTGALQALNEDSSVDTKQFLVDLLYQSDELVKNWQLSLRASYLYQKDDPFYDFFPDSYLNMLGQPIVINNNSSLEAVASYNEWTSHALRLAAGIKFFDTETEQYKNFGPAVTQQFGPLIDITDSDYTFMEDQNRSLWYLSLQDTWSIARGLDLTAGIRYDKYDDFGSTINPRLALVWEARYDLTAKLLYGSAFRAPSFAEQYTQNNPVAKGNPDLDPETIDTYEFALDWQPNPDLRIIPNIFYYRIDDLIDFPGSLPAMAQNVKSQKGYGSEIQADWQVSEILRLTANVAYQRSKDRDTGDIVPDTPAWQFYASAD